MPKEKIFIFLSFLITVIFLSSLFVFAWQEPTSNPPGGNVYAPVNVGPTSQTKTGNLTLQNLYLNATASEGNIYKINQLIGYNDIFVKGNSNETAPIYLAGNKIYAYTNSQPRLFIDTNGNIGIGTTRPGAKLEVSGSIRAYNPGSPDYGVAIKMNTSGGWARAFNFLDSSNNRLGGFGALGSANSLTYLWAGPWYNNPWMVWRSGNVGIGTTDPGSYKLYVNGDVAVSESHGYFYASDRSFKTDIQPLENSLNRILNLQGVSFNWKNTGEPSIGLIAQDVEKIFPEVVSGKEGEKTIDYGKLVAPLIEALKEQQKEIEKLKAEIEELKLKIK